jgi:hypothetical protein
MALGLEIPQTTLGRKVAKKVVFPGCLGLEVHRKLRFKPLVLHGRSPSTFVGHLPVANIMLDSAVKFTPKTNILTFAKSQMRRVIQQ